MSIVEPEKKKRKLVDLSTKLAILKHLDDNYGIRATADKFKLSKGTAQSAKHNRETLLKEAESNRSLSKARIAQQSDINVVFGESGNADLAGAEQWKSSLTTIFTGYDLRNVFNMDETKGFLLSITRFNIESCRTIM
ncbi:hypothetical protein BASA60_007896 [Batrachochytrium salamandrivorans]|nr:hypothetical protein BASA60_007896 [Batrachochytrium salamandrivorans]